MRMIQLLAAATIAAAAPATAAGFTDPAVIDHAVAQFTGVSVGGEGGARLPVDRRLKLSQCDAPLALEWYGRNRDSVLVRCPVAGGWRIYVPVVTAPVAAKAEPAVNRGDTVALVVQGRGFTLSRQGEALEGGAVGEWIRVRPVGEKTDPVRLRIVEPGKVGMSLP